MAGIYIHIPFCRKACLYCDFHFSTNLDNKKKLVDAICEEINSRHNYLESQTVNSIYFGGGTPSLLSPEELEQILATIHSNFVVNKKAEVTFELNPEDAEIIYLRAIKRLGINRLSIGLQSFDEDELKWMNRAHNAQQNFDCIKIAQQAGFDNISIDLIYGSKFQTIGTWKKTLQTAFELNTQHISSYNLTVENRTQLQHLIKEKKEKEVDSETSSQLFDILMEETKKNGFNQYEISNFCKPDFMAQHNSNYWKGLSYLGIGPSAHSYNGISRRFNVRSNAQYIQAIEGSKTFYEEEILTANDKYNEYILTRLRTEWGCDVLEIQNDFGKKYYAYFLSQLELYKQKNFVEIKQNTITLTKQGKHFADGIASDLFYTKKDDCNHYA
ncbi:MAG TPA: radical SAM family heme chaperone HemW [Bacteroidia bacterium]|nr:radical SAM family heme chaperone HemW [Bacteroidia bacterium]